MSDLDPADIEHILKDLEHTRRSVICLKWGLTHFSLMKIISDQYTHDGKTETLLPREDKTKKIPTVQEGHDQTVHSVNFIKQ
jgi:hypothetical protein